MTSPSVFPVQNRVKKIAGLHTTPPNNFTNIRPHLFALSSWQTKTDRRRYQSSAERCLCRHFYRDSCIEFIKRSMFVSNRFSWFFFVRNWKDNYSKWSSICIRLGKPMGLGNFGRIIRAQLPWLEGIIHPQRASHTWFTMLHLVADVGQTVFVVSRAPLGWGRGWPYVDDSEYIRPHTGYLAEFGSSKSGSTNRQRKKSVHRVPLFKVTQDHRKCHGAIRYPASMNSY